MIPCTNSQPVESYHRVTRKSAMATMAAATRVVPAPLGHDHGIVPGVAEGDHQHLEAFHWSTSNSPIKII
jgi:hypothetical protein